MVGRLFTYSNANKPYKIIDVQGEDVYGMMIGPNGVLLAQKGFKSKLPYMYELCVKHNNETYKVTEIKNGKVYFTDGWYWYDQATFVCGECLIKYVKDNENRLQEQVSSIRRDNERKGNPIRSKKNQARFTIGSLSHRVCFGRSNSGL